MAKSGADIYQPNIHRYPGSQLHTTATCLPASPCAHILSTTAISHLQPLPTEPFWHKFHTTNTATTGFSDGTTQYLSTATATATIPSRSKPFCNEQSRKTHPFKRKSLWDNDTSKPQLNSNPEEFLNKEENVI